MHHSLPSSHSRMLSKLARMHESHQAATKMLKTYLDEELTLTTTIWLPEIDKMLPSTVKIGSKDERGMAEISIDHHFVLVLDLNLQFHPIHHIEQAPGGIP